MRIASDKYTIRLLYLTAHIDPMHLMYVDGFRLLTAQPPLVCHGLFDAPKDYRSSRFSEPHLIAWIVDSLRPLCN